MKTFVLEILEKVNAWGQEIFRCVHVEKANLYAPEHKFEKVAKRINPAGHYRIREVKETEVAKMIRREIQNAGINPVGIVRVRTPYKSRRRSSYMTSCKVIEIDLRNYHPGAVKRVSNFVDQIKTLGLTIIFLK
jgi:hypothetical protein